MKINITYLLILPLFFITCKEDIPLNNKNDDLAKSPPVNPPANTGISSDNTNRTAQQLTIGFYNCENLFDTKDDAGKDDSEFTPNSSKKYTDDIYELKISNIARAISNINKDSSYPLAIIGLVEVEKKAVLEKLIQDKSLINKNLQIIHQESSDPRGIDGAILYDSTYFKPSNVQLLSPFNNSREILWVTGLLKNKKTHLFVNHWTSRIRGGEDKRISYAEQLRTTINSIKKTNPEDNFIIMGDFNDNPNNSSIKNYLITKSTPPHNSEGLYNPFYQIYSEGLGTSIYQSAWDCFDQIILYNVHPNKKEIFILENAGVVRNSFLLKGSPPIPNAPKRFYEGNTLVGGYSDHLPVFIKIK